MLPRLVYLAITNTFALLRLLPGSDRDKDVEILALRHELAVLQRQLDGQRVRFQPAERAWLAALLHHLPRPALRSLRLLVQPDTILRWVCGHAHPGVHTFLPTSMWVQAMPDVFDTPWYYITRVIFTAIAAFNLYNLAKLPPKTATATQPLGGQLGSPSPAAPAIAAGRPIW